MTETLRYTLTYTPSLDRILPSPSHLHVKIRNTSAIPLRAAYLVGPYTLYAACYPSEFDPNTKSEVPSPEDAPDFEPNLKAGGSWSTRLHVPESIRENAGKASAQKDANGSSHSVTWIIDISSQVIFSLSAAVHFEVIVGRDEHSIHLGSFGLGAKPAAAPGQLDEHMQKKKTQSGGHQIPQFKGVFSPAVRLLVDDTESLWNSPPFPTWSASNSRPAEQHETQTVDHNSAVTGKASPSDQPEQELVHENKLKQKKVHLVVLTHGLHSNLGSDMLYLKESIDTAARQAKDNARRRKSKRDSTNPGRSSEEQNGARPSRILAESPTVDGQRETTMSTGPKGEEKDGDTKAELKQETADGLEAEDLEEEEDIIVRGFPGNACRTERGIQYLGKRLAKWVLAITYPDQEYLPQKQSVKKKISRAFTGDQAASPSNGKPQHHHSSIYHPPKKPESKAYKITSISFVAHSLGGLTQTYAIAYIHKHSPNFFNDIRPVNFVAMAAPFLGLNNENPLYVRFALDFGLVGRTGQDLGLAWRAPTMVRSGWDAMIGGVGSESQRTQKQLDSGSKPLLRILPTGHTHQVLKLFRNRTVYSNVVNDGIVPLRTSCLLFLDWSGLDRVEKARREDGLIGTTLGWGWAELTGVNSTTRAHLRAGRDGEAWSQSDISMEDASLDNTHSKAEVPQPSADAVTEDNASHQETVTRSRSVDSRSKGHGDTSPQKRRSSVQHQITSPINSFLSFLRPNAQKPHNHHQSPKQTRIYQRSQTTKADMEESTESPSGTQSQSRSPSPGRPGIVRGSSLLDDPNNVHAPPKTSIFESAGDILNPPLPTKDFITDPESRPRTIFHDRVYHPEDIPPPPSRKPSRLSRSSSSDSRGGLSKPTVSQEDVKDHSQEFGSMKVEEKIARAYHHGLSWRKVLVRLEPDAHNNMIVRRMFANAYGWPVVKHLVDTHFADTYSAKTADVYEPNDERAVAIQQRTGEHGDEVVPDRAIQHEIRRTDSEMREATDNVSEMRHHKEASSKSSSYSSKLPSLSRQDSAQWDDSMFDISDDSDEDGSRPGSSSRRPHISLSTHDDDGTAKGTSEAEIADFLTRSPLPVDSPLASARDQRGPRPSGGTSAVGLGKSLEDQLNLIPPGRLPKTAPET